MKVLDLYPRYKLLDRIGCSCGETLIFTTKKATGNCPACGKKYDRALVGLEVKKMWLEDS